MKTALVTGASRGLGLALARALAERDWRLVIDARGAEALEAARQELAALTEVVALPGDVADDAHRRALVAAAGDRLDLLVNNASVLGPSPQPLLAEYPLEELERVYRTNTLAPLALVQLALPLLAPGRPHRQRHLGRGRRGLRGLGRLRLVEGGSRAAHERARRRASRAPRLPGRPRGHEYGASSRRPSRARTSRTGRRRRRASRRLLALIEGELPSGRYGARELAGVA